MSLAGNRLHFFHVTAKIKDHLNYSPGVVVVLVIAINVSFQLETIHNDLLPALLECHVHVAVWSGSDVIPKKVLATIPGVWSSMHTSHSPPLGISKKFFPHSSGYLISTLPNDRPRVNLP
jgi:hypothetical protein